MTSGEKWRSAPEAALRLADPVRLHYGRHINTDEMWEVGYWAARFAVSRAELIGAVAAVGNQVASVQKYLENESSSWTLKAAGRH